MASVLSLCHWLPTLALEKAAPTDSCLDGADIINGIGCEGIPFVKGKDLQEMDTKINLGRFMRRGGKGEKESVQRFTAENILWNQFCNHRN